MAKVKLNDVAVEARETWKQNKTDVPVVGLEHLEPDEIWLRRWDLNPDENTFTKGFRKGQLLFGRRRAYQKKMSVASCDGICSGDITVIAVRPEKILPELLPFYLRTDAFFDFAVRGSGGSLSPRVKWSHISDYEFDLPPMEEQKKLAELLWAANDLKEKYKKAITATDEMLKAKFREMFGEVGNVKDGSRGDAEMRSLKEFVKIVTGKRDANFGNEKGMYPFYTCAKEVSHCDSYSFDCDAILIAGNCDIGNISRYDGKFEAYQRTYVLTLSDNATSLDYLYWVLKLLWVEETRRKMNGSTIPYIKLGMLADYEFPLPSLSLQREFVAIAEKAESAKAALKKSIADIDQVMKGLING